MDWISDTELQCCISLFDTGHELQRNSRLIKVVQQYPTHSGHENGLNGFCDRPDVIDYKERVCVLRLKIIKHNIRINRIVANKFCCVFDVVMLWTTNLNSVLFILLTKISTYGGLMVLLSLGQLIVSSGRCIHCRLFSQSDPQQPLLLTTTEGQQCSWGNAYQL